MTARLIGAAAAFSGTVLAGLLAGLAAARLLHADMWIVVGFFGGLALGVAAIAVALRPLMKSS
jgi:hypothetical protein